MIMTLGIYAQGIVVVGQVIAEDSVPLTSAEVWFANTNTGTITNEEGFFYLRSTKPHKYLNVQIIGYKPQHIKLDYGHDQMLQVVMEEDIALLSEITVGPDDKQVSQLMKNVYLNRDNHPNVASQEINTQLNLANIPNKMLQKKIFRDIKDGVIDKNDTSFSIPAYRASSVTQETGQVFLYEEGLPVFDNGQWRELIASYTPSINLYRPNVTIAGANFASPVCKSPKFYYKLYLVDSVLVDGKKQYQVLFKPKSTNGLYLQGTLMIDSATYAIEGADIETSPYTNVNILNKFSYKLEKGKTTQALSLGYNPFKVEGMDVFGFMLFTDKNDLSFTDSQNGNLDSLVQARADSLAQDSVSKFMKLVSSSFVVKTVAFVVDFLMTEYIHAGPIDIGPVCNMFHYNTHDGATPVISLRTNAKTCKYFTIGGYYGFAHKIHEHLYGGNLQFMTKNEHHIFGLHYDHKQYKFGFDENYVLFENNVLDADHLTNSIRQLKVQNVSTMIRSIAAIRYTYSNRYDNTNFMFKTDLFGQRIGEIGLDNIGFHYDIRLSWNQKYLDTFFNKYWLGTKYPVVHAYGEFGYYDAGGGVKSHYGKIGLYANQIVPVGFGKLSWTFNTAAVIGSAPYPMLIYPRASRGAYVIPPDFSLLNQMEFASDIYFGLTLRYQTQGFIFGYIPKVQKLGIREDIYFNMCYGTLSERHGNVMPLPEHICEWKKVPYMECGFGLSNILSLARIQFMFRLTYRDNPDAQLFKVKWSVEI